MANPTGVADRGEPGRKCFFTPTKLSSNGVFFILKDEYDRPNRS